MQSSANERLLKAAQEGDLVEVQKALIDNADLEARDVQGKATSLHLAVNNGKQEVVRLLLSAGANYTTHTAPWFFNMTPMDMAKKRNDEGMIKLLRDFSRQHRRLNSIAWLIQGDDTCAAACFDGENLLIATNNREPSELSRKVMMHLIFVAQTSYDFMHTDLNDPVKSKLSYTKLKQQHQQSKNTVLKYVDEYYEQMLQNQEETLFNNATYYKTFCDSLDKMTRSLRHAYVYPNSSLAIPNKLAEAIRLGFDGNKIKFLKPEMLKGQRNPHAELKIVQWLLDINALGIGKKYYLGVFKRCCMECENAILAINRSDFRKVKESFFVRDEGHKRHYIMGLNQIPFFLESEKSLRDIFLSLSGNAARRRFRNVKDVFTRHTDLGSEKRQEFDRSESQDQSTEEKKDINEKKDLNKQTKATWASKVADANTAPAPTPKHLSFTSQMNNRERSVFIPRKQSKVKFGP